jgi:hypothetical protein
MSETPHNDTERDARLTAIYRAAAQDAPPAALDAAILAAARREVGARPRPAGFAFRSSWRTSLSIAAVIVLSVSLVTLMREEAPELTAPPAETKLKSTVSGDDNAVKDVVRDGQTSKNIGLKPSQSASSSGLGMRRPEFTEPSPRSKKDAGRLATDTGGPAELEARRDADELRRNKVAASSERQRSLTSPDVQREFAQPPAATPSRKEEAKLAQLAEPAADRPAPFPAAGALLGNKTSDGQGASNTDRGESASRAQSYAPARQAAEASPPPVAMAKMAPPASAAKPALPPAGILAAPAPAAPQAALAPALAVGGREGTVDLAPEKWLERIEELRKQGRLDEAKTSLAEFRKRYPDYQLPDSLRNLAKP